jgi:hypothetical protein
MIERRVFESHPLIPLRRPLLRWAPGDSHPTRDDFERIAEKSRKRWDQQKSAVEVFTTTPTAVHIFGAFAGARHGRHCEATHDLHLSEVFLRHLTGEGSKRSQWLGESAFPKLGFEIKGMKNPDAFLLDATGQVRCVVEFSGVYTAEHLARFHAHCAGEAARRLSQWLRSHNTKHLTRLYAETGTNYEIW